MIVSLWYVHCYKRIMDDLLRGRKSREEDSWLSGNDVKQYFRTKRHLI